MNNAKELSRIKSFQLTLGLIPIPESVRNAIPGYVKNDTPSTGNKGKTRAYFYGEKRKFLLENIGIALKENITDVRDIFEYLLGKEEETGQEIIPRNRSGGLMADSTFRDYVLVQKRVGAVKKPSLREQIIDLHNQRFSELEIRGIINCRKEHIHRCLVDAGLKSKKATPNRIYRHTQIT